MNIAVIPIQREASVATVPAKRVSISEGNVSASESPSIPARLFETIDESDFKTLKAAFLLRLKSGDKYKRYTGTPIRYAGGKTLAVGYIVELLPDNLQRIISPFFGGGSLEIARVF
jgi:hypothetical protein